ncbi:non-ribosomal peptide synthetase [Paenibacillus dendritiformis]|nr:non-ribosomal peptide synthetase [Paenibacillus dendritiformis]CAH8768786.1 amino acid adenylation domain-containing protein [Paenibacillus dendritiformis]
MENYFPLSYGQKGIWYVEQLYPHTSISNNGAVIKLNSGEGIDFPGLNQAIQAYIAANDNIRLRISGRHTGEPMQYIAAYTQAEVPLLDYSGAEEREAAIQERIYAQLNTPFPLFDADLFYFAIFKLSDKDAWVYLNIHHVISDAVSVMHAITSILDIYLDIRRGAEGQPKPYASFLEYMEHEKQYESSARFRKDRDYWENMFATSPEVTSLKPTDFYRTNPASKRKTVVVPEDSRRLLDSYAQEHQVSILNLFLSAIFIYLHKMTSKTDIVIGTMYANRTRPKEKDLFGMIVSTIPLRSGVNPNMAYQDYLKTLSVQQLGMMRHQKYPYPLILNSWRERHQETGYLYSISFQHIELNLPPKDGIHYEVDFLYNQAEINDLAFHLIRHGKKENMLSFDIDYRIELFSDSEIDQMMSHIMTLLHNAVSSPERKIAELDMLTEQERQAYLDSSHSTRRSYDLTRPFHCLFERQAAQSPDSVAVVCGERTLTYEQLNSRANQVARYLRRRGVVPESRVGILADRSFAMVIGALAVMKAGGAYVPIDPEYPLERIQAILRDSEAGLLLCEQGLIDPDEVPAEAVYFEQPEIEAERRDDPENRNTPDDLCYVIYTSGTTGTPKGVMIEHRNYVNLSFAYQDTYGLSESIRLLQLASFAFDVFAGDMARALLNGGQLVLCPAAVKTDPLALYRMLEEHRITMMESTPALIVPFLDYIYENRMALSSLRLIVMGADSCPAEDFKRLIGRFGSRVTILNTYGVTEATVETSVYDVEPEAIADSGITPIGKPLPNMSMYIMNEHGNLLPPGVIGELYIGGLGVGRGYLNKPELTADKFIPHPYSPSERLYKTGDMAKWLPDGNIHFVGRNDDQVKIRGYRIELGEVESRLLQCEPVKKAVVTAAESKTGQKYLAAYYEAEAELPAERLKEHLLTQLPSYMVPSVFMWMERLPLTLNNKIDRRALPAPDQWMGAEAEAGPMTDALELDLAQLWTEILGQDEVSRFDDFLDLGGHSLKAALLITRIQKRFGIHMALRDLFLNTRFQDMAAFIRSAAPAAYAPIAKAEARDAYPVTAAQQKLYLLSALADDSIVNNMPFIMKIEGKLDRQRMELALQQLIRRHEALRTSFDMIGGEPVQRIHEQVEFSLACQTCQPEQAEHIIREWIRPFPLHEAPLWRSQLLRLEERTHLFMLDLHHIIFDGFSLQLFMQELLHFYRHEGGGDLPAPRIQYKDYAVWEQRRLRSGELQASEQYWLDALSGELPVLQLPTDYARTPFQAYEGALFEFDLSAAAVRALRHTSAEQGMSVYTILLAAYFLLLHKYTGQQDVVVGTPAAGRTHADVQDVLGMFVRMLPLRGRPQPGISFQTFLEEVNGIVIGAHDRQDYPLELLQDRLPLQRDPSRHPVYETVFAWQTVEAFYHRTEELVFSPYEFSYNVSKVDLTLEGAELNDTIGFRFEYSTSLFARETIERMAAHFEQIIRAALARPEARIADIEIVTDAEKAQLLGSFAGTAARPLPYRTLAEQFEAQAEKTPDERAAVFRDDVMTYRELNSRANRLAHALRAKGVGPDDRVGLMTAPSFGTLVGIVGILKAGGAYVPIDPDYPAERIGGMLEDSGARLLVTQQGLQEGAASFAGEVLLLEHVEAPAAEALRESCRPGGDAISEPGNPEPVNGPDDLAYVIYTSGSTGTPKGVMIEHRSVLHLADWFGRLYGLAPGQNVLHMTSSSFDVSVEETLVSLLHGANVVIAEKPHILVREQFIPFLNKHQIHLAQFVPATLQELLADQAEQAPSLRAVLCGGERLDPVVAEKVLAQGYRLYNHYGPTETTVDATRYACVPGGKALLGRPVEGTEILVLDRHGKLAPIGVPGELCIAGTGLARGYLNRPELTAEKFVPHPYKTGERMYRSGDEARWLPDGNLEYLGRLDQQVKVRGYRIEPGEVSHQLLQHPVVREALVTAEREEGGHAYLCAYLVTERECTATELRAHLSRTMPEYMIPSYFVRLGQFPLLPNGKIDLQALPAPDRDLAGTEYAPPENEIQAILAEVWQDVLGVERIGILDRFFDYGGDSIKAIQIAARLNRHSLKLEMKDLFLHPTIEQLSPLVKRKELQFDQSPVEGRVRLTPIQHWFFEQNFRNRQQWNQAEIFFRQEGFDPELLERALHKIVEHHDALRLVFHEQEREIAQINQGTDGTHFTLEVMDLRGHADWAERIEADVLRLQGGIDLSTGPLVKAGLYQTAEGDHLAIVIHHLAIDGVSWRILIEDVSAAYEAAAAGQPIALPDKTHSYQRWAEELSVFAASRALLQEIPYWANIENAPADPLPQRRCAASNTQEDSATVTFRLSADETECLLKKANQAYRTEPNDILLAALGLALRDWGKMERIAVELEGHGREEIVPDLDITRTIGWFTSAFPVILHLSPEDDAKSALIRTKETLHHIPRKGIGYGVLKYLTPPQHLGGLNWKLKPEISFNYLGQFGGEEEGALFAASPLTAGGSMHRLSERTHALDITSVTMEGRLLTAIQYNSREYSEHDMQELAEQYRNQLLHLIDHCMSIDEGGLTPSDLDDQELTVEELDDILELVKEL